MRHLIGSLCIGENTRNNFLKNELNQGNVETRKKPFLKRFYGFKKNKNGKVSWIGH